MFGTENRDGSLTRRRIKEGKFTMGEHAWEGPTVFIVISAKFMRAVSLGYRIASTFAVALSVHARARSTIDTVRKKE